jgi:hypothetical protein
MPSFFNADGAMSLAFFEQFAASVMLTPPVSFGVTAYAESNTLTQLSFEDLQALHDEGVAYLCCTGSRGFDVTLTFYNEMLDSGLNFSSDAEDVVRVTPAEIEAMSPAEISALSGFGIGQIQFSTVDASYQVTLEQTVALGRVERGPRCDVTRTAPHCFRPAALHSNNPHMLHVPTSTSWTSDTATIFRGPT